MPTSAHAELIVLAAPGSADQYYTKNAEAIFEFHVGFARQIEGRDEALVLTDEQAYPRYVAALGADRVAIAPQLDIWMRDFTLHDSMKPVMFRYTAAGQGGGQKGQKQADEVQETLAALAEQAGLAFRETDLFNDGGNFVDDYAGNAVVSRKFLRDNRLTEDGARQRLKQLLGLQHVAFIESDEQGGLEHADGVVSFIDADTLIVNSYPTDPAYAAQLRRDLEKGLPGVRLHEIVTPYNSSRISDKRFGSACGLYTNALVTPTRIYLPQFGSESDAAALLRVRGLTRKEVVPVNSGGVCHMGGGVRCMSWQLRGEAATRFKARLLAETSKTLAKPKR